jgi:putative DNA primase/helicase
VRAKFTYEDQSIPKDIMMPAASFVNRKNNHPRISAADFDTVVPTRLGLKHVTLNQWRGDCPVCGSEDYKLTLTVSRDLNYSYITHCACDEDEIVNAIQRAARGGAAVPPLVTDQFAVVDPDKVARQRTRALRMFREGYGLEGTLAQVYLESRAVGHLVSCEELVFSPSCRDLEDPCGRNYHPTLIAAIVDINGAFQAIHRTFLAPDGSTKAFTAGSSKRSRATLGQKRGGAIRLDPADTEICIGEGIESSASAGKRFSLPAWSGVDAGNLVTVILPPEIKNVLIAADPDKPGEKAARRVAERWAAEGRRVRIARSPLPGADFNDLAMRGI